MKPSEPQRGEGMSEEAGAQRPAIPITVLVVEDEETTRRLCADVAESCGMKALVAGTGSVAAS